MGTRRKPKSLELSSRVRHLLAVDAANVLERLASRGSEMVSLFSRLRSRAPLLETTATWFTSASFAELASLSPSEQRAVNAFYRELDELRWYLAYTEDMPKQLHEKLSVRVISLEKRHRELVVAIGPADGVGGPVIQARSSR